jgi:hypothetical protein
VAVLGRGERHTAQVLAAVTDELSECRALRVVPDQGEDRRGVDVVEGDRAQPIAL